MLPSFRWDSGSNVGEFDGHSRRVLSCAFKPTRPFRIVTCGEDFLVNFYEGPPFKFKLSSRSDITKHTRKKEDRFSISVLFPPCSCVSELLTKFFFFCFVLVVVDREHSNFVNCVRFAPDGNKFITVSSDKKGIIYDGKTCEKLGELSSEDGHRGSIYAVSWSPDGTQVLTYTCFRRIRAK